MFVYLDLRSLIAFQFLLKTYETACEILVDVGLLLYVPVYSYGHVRTFKTPNHTFFEQAVNQYFVHILLLVTDNNLS